MKNLENENIIENLRDNLTSIFNKNREAVEVFNFVKNAELNYKHSRIASQKKVKRVLFLSIIPIILIGIIAVYSILNDKPKQITSQNNIINDTSDFRQEVVGEVTHTLPINNDTNQIQENKESIKIKYQKDSSRIISSSNLVDSVMVSYTIKLEKDRYTIFEINNKIIDNLNQNGFKLMLSESNRSSCKTISRVTNGFSEQQNTTINYNIEYNVALQDQEYIIKMRLINKSALMHTASNDEISNPNSIEKRFYNLMKEQINLFY